MLLVKLPCNAMSVQKTDAATLHTKGAPFYGKGYMDGMSRTLSWLGASVENTTWTTTDRYCLLRPTMVLTVFGHGQIQRETMSGLRRTWLSSLQMDSGLCPNAKSDSWQSNTVTMVMRFVDIPGEHRYLIKQETMSFSHQLAGIRAFTMTNSIKQSSKHNYLQLHQ